MWGARSGSWPTSAEPLRVSAYIHFFFFMAITKTTLQAKRKHCLATPQASFWPLFPFWSPGLPVLWRGCITRSSLCSEKHWAEAWTVKPGRTGRGIWLLLSAVRLANRELSRQAVFHVGVRIGKNWSLLWTSEAWGKHGLRSLHLDCDCILKPPAQEHKRRFVQCLQKEFSFLKAAQFPPVYISLWVIS